MGILDRLKGKGKELSDMQKAVVLNTLAGESQRTLTEHEEAQNLGINLHMIKDEGLSKWLSSLAVVKGEDGDGSYVDLNMLALAVKCSHLIRTSFMDEYDARIKMLEAEQFVDRVELEMDEDTYDYGGTNFLEALCDIQVTSWSDSIRGRKALLLKVQQRSFEVNVPEKKQPPQTEKKGGLFG